MPWDDVTLFGLDGLGDPTGLPAIYGAMIGAGVSLAAEIGTKQFWPTQAPNAELVGLGAGVLASGAMIAFPQTRHAGWTSGAVVLISSGLRVAAKRFGGLAGMGMVRTQALPRRAAGAVPGVAGLGMVQARQLGTPGGVKLLGKNGAHTAMSTNYGTSYSAR